MKIIDFETRSFAVTARVSIFFRCNCTRPLVRGWSGRFLLKNISIFFDIWIFHQRLSLFPDYNAENGYDISSKLFSKPPAQTQVLNFTLFDYSKFELKCQ